MIAPQVSYANPRSLRKAGPASSRSLRLADAEGVSRQPGLAAGGGGGVLLAALDRAAPDPHGHHTVAADRPGGIAADARTLPRMAGSRPVARDRERTRRLSGAPELDRMAAFRDDAFLQLACLHGARERDVGDLRPPCRGPAPPLRLLGADALLLHPLARYRPLARDARGRGPAGDRPGKREPVRPRVVAPRSFGRSALSARSRRRDLRAD